MIKILDIVIGSGFLYFIALISLNYWVKKRDIEAPPYFVYIISLVLIISIFPLFYIFDTLIAMLITYFIDTILGALLIAKFYKTDFLNSLKFTSWLIFGLLFLFYFAVIAIGFAIFGIGSFFV